jgi:hypothetical protein
MISSKKGLIDLTAWFILVASVLVVFFFFDLFEEYFLGIAIIGLLFILFHILDDLLFSLIAKKTTSILSGNLLIRSLKAFPIFLFGIYLIFFLSSRLEHFLSDFLSEENLTWWYALIWIGIMYAFYYLKLSRD